MRPRDAQMACTHTAAMAVLGTLGGAHGSNRNVARCYRNYRSIRKTDARCLSASFTMSSLPYPRERVLKDATRTNTGGSALIHMHVSQLNELPLTAEVWNE